MLCARKRTEDAHYTESNKNNIVGRKTFKTMNFNLGKFSKKNLETPLKRMFLKAYARL